MIGETLPGGGNFCLGVFICVGYRQHRLPYPPYGVLRQARRVAATDSYAKASASTYRARPKPLAPDGDTNEYTNELAVDDRDELPEIGEVFHLLWMATLNIDGSKESMAFQEAHLNAIPLIMQL